MSGADTVCIGGFRVDAMTVDALHGFIDDAVSHRRKALVLHVNAHAVNEGFEEPWFRDFVNGADIVFADGAGIVLAGRLLGHRLPERITYADWTWQLARHCSRMGHSIFLLGSRPGVAEKARDQLIARFRELRICGTSHGCFDKTPTAPENLEVIARINMARPNVLMVGFGMPTQERWLRDNWPAVEVNVALTCGAAFDYVSGRVRRGPAWMTDRGLEWLARLWFEPRRLWRRYLIGNPLFLWRVLTYRDAGDSRPRSTSVDT